MFLLKKIIASLLVPPGAVILLLCLTVPWLWRRKQRGFAMLNLAIALMLWAMSITPVSHALTSSLEKGLAIPPHPRGDVIILLGGGIHEGVADLTGRGTPGEDMLARLVTAVRLQRRLNIPVIVSGGSGFAGRSPEAPVIRRFLLDLGVDERQILLDDLSRDTWENAVQSRDIMNRHGFRHPLLVTSAYHMRRAAKMFDRVGVKVTPVPAQFVTGGELPLIVADVLPSAPALLRTEKALREHIGLLFYRLF